jgi:16S rRNA processing protein RimM
VEEPTVVVGRVTRAHGLRGEVAVLPASDNPDRFSAGASVFLQDGDELRIRAVRSGGGRLLVVFEGVDDRAAAEALHDATLVVPRSMLPPLPEGEYWPHELEGCVVLTESGRELGRIADVVANPAHDLWVAVDDGGAETLLPAVHEVVVSVDVVGKRVVVRELRGLTVPETD